MALFPQCRFQIHLPNGAVTSGAPVEGVLELNVPEPIPRAEHIDLVFRSSAWAGYGTGKDRKVIRQTVFAKTMRVDLPIGQPLPAGNFRYPFSFELPPFVPPALRGDDCGIESSIEARIDVDWAVDPAITVTPVVLAPPVEVAESKLVMRSPIGFHDSIVLELTLQSSVIVRGQAFIGRIALRGGQDAPFDAIALTLASGAYIAMAEQDYRRSVASPSVLIPRDVLLRGEPVPFVVTPFAGTPHTFRSQFIDHTMNLEVTVKASWGRSRTFSTPVMMLPFGSVLHPSTSGTADALGTERLRLLSSFMADATGLHPGRPPTLVAGPVGPTRVVITDSPRGGRLGVDVEIVFPDVELGTAFRPLGMLEGFRDSPLLPEPLRTGYLLRFTPTDARPPIDETALATFVWAALGELRGEEEVRLSDHHLGWHVPIANDDSEQLQSIARLACAKAKAIADAIAALPFPAPARAARPAWLATASEQSAVLVPTGPALHGIVFRMRILGGEERAVVASIRSIWRNEGAATAVALALSDMPLPTDAIAELDGASGERLAAVRAVFPQIRRTSFEHVVLERQGFTHDPRSLFAGIETFIAWLLESRGERRADAPYR